MPRHPQPVPPIYQPEVIARAVYWAAHHRRRAFAVGFPTVQAIIGDKFIPGTLDHYLASIGYESQQTQEPVQPGRPDNLYRPLPGDYGARGQFSDRALDYSVQAWMNQHRGWLALAGMGLAAWWIQARSRSNSVTRLMPRPASAVSAQVFDEPVTR